MRTIIQNLLRSRFLYIVISVSIAASPALAFDIFPEFHSLTEAEASSLDQTYIIDSEYQSDAITYMRPSHWDAEFHAASMAFDLTFGSFNNTHFLHYDRLKLRKSLLDTLEFRFTYFKERDFDTDQSHAILELVQRLSPRFSLSVYGQPSHFKRQNDLGIALLVHFSETHELRVYNTWVDFTRPEHNDRTDTFVKGNEPIAIGFTDRWYSPEGSTPGQFFETYLRYESPVRWDFKYDRYEYKYNKFTIGTGSRLSMPWWNDTFLNTRIQYSKKHEGFEPYADDSPKTQSSLERSLFKLALSAEFPAGKFYGRNTVIEPGLGWFHRTWYDDKNESLEHRSFLANIWLKFEGPERRAGQFDEVSLGYETTFFSSAGDPKLAANELKSWAVEHRANLRYTFRFHDRAELAVTVSGDPDAAVRGSGGLFEGGNGQFRVFF